MSARIDLFEKVRGEVQGRDPVRETEDPSKICLINVAAN